MADFPYKKLKNNTIRPIIPIVVNYGTKGLKYEVLVDSGADICVFDAEVGEALGIDIKTGIKDEIKGIDGVGLECWFHEVKLTVLGEAIVTTKVAFTYGLPSVGIGIVGQAGFFEKFVVRFDYSNNKVSITKNNSRLVN